jgi:ABC-type nickel/cobalt efflux system permease component RcnA
MQLAGMMCYFPAAAAAAGTLFEIGSWLLYWEALNPEPQVVTGRELQHPQHHKHQHHSHSHNHSHDHTHSHSAGHEATATVSHAASNAAAPVTGRQLAADAQQQHPHPASVPSSSHSGAADVVIEPAASAG